MSYLWHWLFNFNTKILSLWDSLNLHTDKTGSFTSIHMPLCQVCSTSMFILTTQKGRVHTSGGTCLEMKKKTTIKWASEGNTIGLRHIKCILRDFNARWKLRSQCEGWKPAACSSCQASAWETPACCLVPALKHTHHPRHPAWCDIEDLSRNSLTCNKHTCTGVETSN